MNLSNTTDLFERVSESEFALSEPCLSPKFEQEITIEMKIKKLIDGVQPFDPLVKGYFGAPQSKFELSEPCLSPDIEQEITLEMKVKQLVDEAQSFDPLVTDCFGSSQAEMVASALSSFPQADIMTSNTVGDINIKYGYGMPIVGHHPII
ncbi:hypothetical protein GKR56_13735 [Providencia alcalifaciens]|uniref:hypothetical protein n=1 Tax=Providencia alcalifaciens TaxID=126385 RepID=UPI000DA0D542|nr:hypothetical protein [Providencia alcalifaciens]MTC26688.1 hypothetical protein [Providencia alcalifaciens]MTC54286.1 hypothetical protein [Providencia alcalifaciens]SPY69393.1 Uncharacterised protein [Providencia alcalifaciens]